MTLSGQDGDPVLRSAVQAIHAMGAQPDMDEVRRATIDTNYVYRNKKAQIMQNELTSCKTDIKELTDMYQQLRQNKQ
jgi:hypothetical protein